MESKSIEEMLEASKNNNPRFAAELAYVLAVIHLKKAQEAGRTCLELIGRTKRNTLEDCAPALMSIDEVPIPEIFHEETESVKEARK